MNDLAAKTHRRDAGRAENFKKYARRSMMRWSDSLWHRPLRTLRRCGDMPLQGMPVQHPVREAGVGKCTAGRVVSEKG